MSGSPDPVSIKQEPGTVVTEHSQTPDTDTDRLTLTERDKTKEATESSTFLKTQTAAEVGFDTEGDIKQERSWNETISLQADHDDAACTTEACSDTNSFSDKTCNIHLEADVKQSLTESSTARHDMESTESADMMSQYRKCQGFSTIGTGQVIHIKQEIDTDFYSAAEAQTESSTRSNQPGTLMESSSPSQLTHCTTENIQETRKVQTRPTVKGEPAIMHAEHISQGFGPCATSRSPGDARSNDTHTDSIPVKTEPQEPFSFTATPPVMTPVVDSVSDVDVELEKKPKQVVFPVGLYRNFHASDCKPETSVTGQLGGETTAGVCDARRLDTSECEMHQQHTGQDEKSGFSTDYPCIKQLLNQSAQTPRGMVSQTCGQLPIMTTSDSKTNESLFSCKQCRTAFSNSSDLNNHMKVHTENRPYVCKQCGSAFKSTGLLKKHMKTHTEDGPYVCKQCGSAFKSKDLVKKHMKVHTENRSYVCKQCGRAYKSTGLLNRHMKTHAENRPHVCKQCGAAFKYSCILNRHMMIHTGDKPYACDQCEAAYSQSHHLKEHMLTHTGEKPFACKECGKLFTQSRYLKLHVITHTGEKPYVCKECGKAFNRSSNLKAHMQSHTGDRPYVCKQCGITFTWFTQLRRHVRTHATVLGVGQHLSDQSGGNGCE